MEYQEEVENSPMLRMPDLSPRVEDQYHLEVLTWLEYVLTQVLERVDEGNISPAQGVVTECMNSSEGDLKIESDQPPPTLDMSPIRKHEELTLIPYCFLSETKLNVVIDKTQEIILEFLLGSAEIV